MHASYQQNGCYAYYEYDEYSEYDDDDAQSTQTIAAVNDQPLPESSNTESSEHFPL